MKKLLICLSLVTAGPAGLFAQARFCNGFIVGLNADTTRGWIRYNPAWLFPKKNVVFKKDSAAPDATTYPFGTVSYYELSGDNAYKLVTLPRPGAMFLKPGQPQTSTLWLRVLVRGVPLSLYTDDAGTAKYYLAEGQRPILELLPLWPEQIMQYELGGDGYYDKKDWEGTKEYHDAFFAVLQKYQLFDLETSVRQLGFNAGALRSMVEELNSRTGHNDYAFRPHCYSDEESSIFAGAGYAWGRPLYVSDMGAHFRVDFTRCVQSTAAAGMEVVFGRWAMCRLMGAAGKMEASAWQTSVGAQSATRFDYSALVAGCNIYLFARLTGGHPFCLYVGGGVEGGSSLSPKMSSYDSQTGEVKKLMDNPQSDNWVQPSIAAGVKYKKHFDLTLSWRGKQYYYVDQQTAIQSTFLQLSLFYHFKPKVKGPNIKKRFLNDDDAFF